MPVVSFMPHAEFTQNNVEVYGGGGILSVLTDGLDDTGVRSGVNDTITNVRLNITNSVPADLESVNSASFQFRINNTVNGDDTWTVEFYLYSLFGGSVTEITDKLVINRVNSTTATTYTANFTPVAGTNNVDYWKNGTVILAMVNTVHTRAMGADGSKLAYIDILNGSLNYTQTAASETINKAASDTVPITVTETSSVVISETAVKTASDSLTVSVNDTASVYNVPGPQFGRPDGTGTVVGAWTGSHLDVDEVIPNDADFIASSTNPAAADYYTITLSSLLPPVAGNHTIRFRYAKDATAGRDIALNVELRQGDGAVIANIDLGILTLATWQQAEYTLTPQQVANITDYEDLRFRFIPTASGGGAGRAARLSWLEFETPASDPNVPIPKAASDSMSLQATERVSRAITGQQNRLLNPSFEKGIDGWTANNPNVTLSWVGGGGADGLSKLRVTANADIATTFQIASPLVPVNPTIYTYAGAAMSVRLVSGTPPSWGAGITAKTSVGDVNNNSTYSAPTSAWERKTTTRSFGAFNPTEVLARVIFTGGMANGTVVEIDAAQVNELTSTAVPPYDPVTPPPSNISDLADDLQDGTINPKWTAPSGSVLPTESGGMWNFPSGQNTAVTSVDPYFLTDSAVYIDLDDAGSPPVGNYFRVAFQSAQDNNPSTVGLVAEIIYNWDLSRFDFVVSEQGVSGAMTELRREVFNPVNHKFIGFKHGPLFFGDLTGSAVITSPDQTNWTITEAAVPANMTAGYLSISAPSSNNVSFGIYEVHGTVLQEIVVDPISGTDNAVVGVVESASVSVSINAVATDTSVISAVESADITTADSVTVTNNANGTHSGTAYTNPGNVSASDNLYATRVGARRVTETTQWTIPAFTNIPNDATIESITAEKEVRYTAAGGWTQSTGVVVGGVEKFGSGTSSTAPTTDTVMSFNVTSNLSLADLKGTNGTITMRTTHFVDDSATHTASIDVLRITVVYTSGAQNTIKGGTDGGAIAVTDTGAIEKSSTIIASDTSSLAVSESTSSLRTISASDISSLAISEVSSTGSALPGNDSATIGVVEQASIAVSRAGTDTAAISVSEQTTSLRTIQESDTTSISVAETATTLKTSTTSDTVGLAVSETSALSINATKSATDTSVISVSDTASLSIVATKSATDSAAIGVIEAYGIQLSLPKSTTDAVTITVSETSSVVKSLIASDSLVINLSDAAHTEKRLSAADQSGIVVTETSTTTKSLVATDTAQISVSETAVATGTNTAVSGDTTNISVSETTTMYRQISAIDSAQITLTETALKDSGMPGSDTASLSVAESSELVISGDFFPTSSDSSTLSVSEQVTQNIGQIAQDTLGVSLADTSASSVTAVASDSASLSITEGRTASVSLSSTDVAGISVNETTAFIISLSSVDESNITVTETTEYQEIINSAVLRAYHQGQWKLGVAKMYQNGEWRIIAFRVYRQGSWT